MRWSIMGDGASLKLNTDLFIGKSPEIYIHSRLTAALAPCWRGYHDEPFSLYVTIIEQRFDENFLQISYTIRFLDPELIQTVLSIC
jgi:hypothetical protein